MLGSPHIIEHVYLGLSKDPISQAVNECQRDPYITMSHNQLTTLSLRFDWWLGSKIYTPS